MGAAAPAETEVSYHPPQRRGSEGKAAMRIDPRTDTPAAQEARRQKRIAAKERKEARTRAARERNRARLLSELPAMTQQVVQLADELAAFARSPAFQRLPEFGSHARLMVKSAIREIEFTRLSIAHALDNFIALVREALDEARKELELPSETQQIEKGEDQ
jgi:hypothetical protein